MVRLAARCGGQDRRAAMTAPVQAVRLEALIRGAVQGVGFRPFLYRLAARFGVAGEVANTAEGVRLTLEGPRARLEAFLGAISAEKPPLSIIESVDTTWEAPRGLAGFSIAQSDGAGEVAAQVLPDIATCPECLREIHDPHDRHYRYPFTNCTHCGPRFSILRRLPYDRPNTAMAGFAMCAACRAEYENPADRRFHAQPVACPACGPQLALWDPAGNVLAEKEAALRGAAEALRQGQVVAVKGLGGFHLMVDARNEPAVLRLRERKRREEKPFAVMYPDVETARQDCLLSALETELLHSPEAPIVLVRRTEGPTLAAESTAPGAPRFGVLVPYTPLHHLLLEELGFPVVATSGNLSEEPICIDEQEALRRLAHIAELFLVHNRPIVRHVDDSIVHVALGREMVLRRARGYAPLPIRAAESSAPPVAAFGAHMKNCVAVAKGGRVFISQHVGDLETPQAVDAFAEADTALRTLFEVTPKAVGCDLHPDYISTAHAHQTGLPVFAVQHHYAHVLACMAEHGLEGPALGVSWDGTGHGDDGTVWGGEFLAADLDSYRRVAHLRPFPLPGGDKAAREPRRCALGLCFEQFGAAALEMENRRAVEAFPDRERRTLAGMLEKGVNCPATSSVGRLFDAVASLLGLRQYCSFEGQAAVQVEYAARRHPGMRPVYVFPLAEREDGPWLLDWGPMLEAILADLGAGKPVEEVAAGFHDALVRGILHVASACDIPDVVLTGGCFQNVFLTELVSRALSAEGFRVHRHHRTPPNDGCIALGQAVYAMRRAMRQGV